MQVEVIRSKRRTRTISAAVRGDTLVVTIPARLTATQEREWVQRMAERVERARRKAARNRDDELHARAQRLNIRYFEGKLAVTGIIYVDNQRTLHGSCTPSTGLIRINRRLSKLPRWVEDYVIVHELAHLVYGGHGPRFWELVNRYPLAERARGYLMALGYEGEPAAAEEEAS
ncbi:MAG TPA: M48 family metallopeptidase [Chloroflexota bacterium]|nr:M48 family metallopeptidase [Chloroflexota bacterium]